MAIRPGMATIMPWMQLKDANLSAIPLGTTPSERKLLTLQGAPKTPETRGEGAVFRLANHSKYSRQTDQGLDIHREARGPDFEAGPCGVR
jgi:hypothetical protein